MNGDRPLVIAACTALDVEILASRFRLMAANENKIPATLCMAVQTSIRADDWMSGRVLENYSIDWKSGVRIQNRSCLADPIQTGCSQKNPLHSDSCLLSSACSFCG
jgi:hypothetical protein